MLHAVVLSVVSVYKITRYPKKILGHISNLSSLGFSIRIKLNDVCKACSIVPAQRKNSINSYHLEGKMQKKCLYRDVTLFPLG